MLGIAIDGDTLLLNLSSRCADMISALDDAAQQKLCYALVNTLCESKDVRRILFFFDGTMTESLGGSLCWSGEFFASPAMNRDLTR